MWNTFGPWHGQAGKFLGRFSWDWGSCPNQPTLPEYATGIQARGGTPTEYHPAPGKVPSLAGNPPRSGGVPPGPCGLPSSLYGILTYMALWPEY